MQGQNVFYPSFFIFDVFITPISGSTVAQLIPLGYSGLFTSLKFRLQKREIYRLFHYKNLETDMR